MIPDAPGGSKGLALLADQAFAPNLTTYIVYPALAGLTGLSQDRTICLMPSLPQLARKKSLHRQNVSSDFEGPGTRSEVFA